MLKKYPSFWSFVVNYILSSDRKQIYAKYGYKNPGVFWIKKSIEEKTLVFQIQSFASSSKYLLNMYYDQKAWIRNPPENILLALNNLLDYDLSFSEQTPRFRPIEEPIPVAEVSNSINHFAATQFHKNGNILSASQIAYDHIDIEPSDCINGDILTSQSLYEMTRDLEPIDPTDLATNTNLYEPKDNIVSTLTIHLPNKFLFFQDFLLDEDTSRATYSNDEKTETTISERADEKSETDEMNMVVTEETIEANAVYDEELESSVDKTTEASEDYKKIVDGEFM